MIRKKKKVRKYRGSRHHGYGPQGQHRDGGQRGGAGNTGFEKHHWIRTVKYEPERIRKVGFTRPVHLKKNQNSINLQQLDEFLPELLKNNIAKIEGKKYIINLGDIGVNKLLGSGKTKNQFEIQVESASKKAVEKIELLKGKVSMSSVIEKKELEKKD
ncbi:MAG: uL15 family ribosomal protein [Candidatus Ranarchaeia archaeon]